MPLYEYKPLKHRCNYCFRGFEIVQAFDDAPLTACPECGNAVQRVLTGAKTIGKEDYDAQKLAAAGMTTYRRAGKGEYEKVAGDASAPDRITGEDA